MLKANVAAAVMLLAISTAPSFAQSIAQNGVSGGGTPQEKAACRRDVRKFCRHLKAGAGDGAFLRCLQEHREKLSKACGEVLRSHGV